MAELSLWQIKRFGTLVMPRRKDLLLRLFGAFRLVEEVSAELLTERGSSQLLPVPFTSYRVSHWFHGSLFNDALLS